MFPSIGDPSPVVAIPTVTGHESRSNHRIANRIEFYDELVPLVMSWNDTGYALFTRPI